MVQQSFQQLAIKVTLTWAIRLSISQLGTARTNYLLSNRIYHLLQKGIASNHWSL